MIDHLEQLHQLAVYDAAVAHAAHYMVINKTIDWKQFKQDIEAQLALQPVAAILGKNKKKANNNTVLLKKDDKNGPPNTGLWPIL